ncbi:MAG: class I SAM-dependent methyltransferase [Labilithrix sp.]|nr:class I SAM-dependent methyltransferase [Labilithrix sp.]MCW5810319.1 class I SAM-dependent methyltransferase [Labilithrix sp.]
MENEAKAEREPLSSRFIRVLSGGPAPTKRRYDAPEIYGVSAMSKIVRALPAVERTYATIRFAIMRPKLLSVMDLLLPDEGRILDIGCGFGLFAAYFAQTQPDRQIFGVDPNAARIEMAKRVAAEVGVGNTYVAGDARDVQIDGKFAGAYVLDVMHHIPEEDQVALLERIRDMLAPRGVLVIKDITTEPTVGLEFTRLLDRLMVGWREPLCYRHHREWGAILERLGFKVRAVRVPDVMPYPHVVIAATKLG